MSLDLVMGPSDDSAAAILRSVMPWLLKMLSYGALRSSVLGHSSIKQHIGRAAKRRPHQILTSYTHRCRQCLYFQAKA